MSPSSVMTKTEVTTKRASDLNFGEIQRGYCPVCLWNCFCIKLEGEGGRQFGFKHVGDRDFAHYGEVIWDSAHAVYWHMGIEDDYDMSDKEAFDHFIDDMNSMLRQGQRAKAARLQKVKVA